MPAIPHCDAPLGPIRTETIWKWVPGGPTSDEGYEPWDYYYVDQYGNEYNSVEHVALCAVAKELGDRPS